VNNGVYRPASATSQAAYERAVHALFARLDWLEDRLATRRYLVGGRLTEADVRLFTTLARFDAVYVGHFKCNLRRLVDYPPCGRTRATSTRRRLRRPVELRPHQAALLHSRTSGSTRRASCRPGPLVDWTAPHDRARLG
jgi:putative glutathione S-transferase